MIPEEQRLIWELKKEILIFFSQSGKAIIFDEYMDFMVNLVLKAYRSGIEFGYANKHQEITRQHSNDPLHCQYCADQDYHYKKGKLAGFEECEKKAELFFSSHIEAAAINGVILQLIEFIKEAKKKL